MASSTSGSWSNLVYENVTVGASWEASCSISGSTVTVYVKVKFLAVSGDASYYKLYVNGSNVATDEGENVGGTVAHWPPKNSWDGIYPLSYSYTATANSSGSITVPIEAKVYSASSGTTYTIGSANAALTYTYTPPVTNYTVSVRAGTGISSVSGGGTYQNNSTASISASLKEGYNFSYWSSSDYQISYSNPYSFTVNSNITWTAVGRLKTYTVSYNANGGSGAPSSQTKKYGTNLTLSTTKPTRTGYWFKCWNTSSDGNGTTYSPGGTYTANAGTTLYAIWVLNTYSVSYNANGGSGAPSSQIKTYGTNLTLSSTKPTKTGYTFSHWYTNSSNSGGTIYRPGGTYSTEASVTLYAIWVRNTYTVSYNANGGSGAPSSQTKTYGYDLTLSTTVPTKTGYTFKGWSTSSSATSVNYKAGAVYTVDASTTLYAVWQAYTYTVSYNANGGSGAPSSQIKTYGTNLTLSSTKPTKTGYTFLGWSTSSSATSANYYAGGTYSTNASVTLYAVWGINTYTITYSASGASGVPASQSKTYGVNITLSTTKPTLSGYTFLGWSTSSSASSVQYKAGGTYSANASVTLYAVFRKTYTVKFINNGSEITSYNVYQGATFIVPSFGSPYKPDAEYRYTYTYSANNSEATISRTKDNVYYTISYTFDYWEADGKKYGAENAITISGDITFYSHHKESYTWKQYSNYSEVNAFPTGDLEQHELVGWATSTTATAADILSFPPKIQQNTTLYAVWKEDGFKGYLKFYVKSSSEPTQFAVGKQIRLVGLKDSANDGLYTIGKVSTTKVSDGKYLVKVSFTEDFSITGSQNASEKNIQIWGEGSYVPDFDYICSKDNRLWGCCNDTRTIYASALGDPTDFWTFENSTLDAYQVAVASADKFTGIIALNSQVAIMKQHTIHKMIGGYPSEYTLYTYNLEGVEKGNTFSLVNVEGSALYLSEHGLSSYAGSSVNNTDSALGKDQKTDATAMYDGEKYYLYFRDADGNDKTYVYDMRYGMWIQEDYGEVLAFSHYGSDNYVLVKADGRNKIYKITSGVEFDGEWEIIFKPFIETVSTTKTTTHIFEKKRYTKLTLRIELPKGSWIRAEGLFDGKGDWHLLGGANGTQDGVCDLVINTPRVDKLQLKLSGSGAMTILAMERTYQVYSRR